MKSMAETPGTVQEADIFERVDSGLDSDNNNVCNISSYQYG